MRRLLALLIPLIAVAACAGGTKRDAADPSGFNSADITFATEMVPHHEQALQMAELVDGRTDDADVRDLAAAIEENQAPEISTMRGWLDDWGVTISHEGGHHAMGDGMMSDDDLDELASLSGTAFDREWLTLMTQHHRGAVRSAESVVAKGESRDVATFARAVIDQQTDEIELMTQLLKDSA